MNHYYELVAKICKNLGSSNITYYRKNDPELINIHEKITISDLKKLMVTDRELIEILSLVRTELSQCDCNLFSFSKICRMYQINN
jgi:hypothetical protein